MKHIKKFNESELAAYYSNGIGGSSDESETSEESFSMNLEEAAENYAIDKQNDTGSKYYIALESFKAGAEWYKNSIEHDS